MQQLHAGRNVAVPADENGASADEWTGVRYDSRRRLAKPPHPSDRNIPFKEREQLLLFYRRAGDHMAEVDLIDAVPITECIDLL